MVFAWNQRRLAEEAARWGRHLLTAQDEERHRIARELHDDLVHRVLLVQLTADRGATGEAQAQLNEIAARARTMAHDLHPPALEHLDLRQALADLVNRHQSERGPVIELDAPADAKLQGEAAVALYRVAQEAITNALKHANAREVRLLLHGEGQVVRLIVEDDGKGMPPATDRQASFGMRSMRERAVAVGGTLAVERAELGGTRIVARVPLS